MIQAIAAHPILSMAVLCFLCAGLVHEGQRWLLPLRIPAEEIEALADQLIADFGLSAIEVAADNQERAVWRFEPTDEGKWRRVERAIQSRTEMGRTG